MLQTSISKQPGAGQRQHCEQQHGVVCGALRAQVSAAAAERATHLPRSAAEMVQLAVEAVQWGVARGQLRQRLDFMLPVNEKELDFLATEPVDYPCSLAREFEAACALTRLALERLAPGQPLASRRIDDGGVEGEPCALIYTESKSHAAVVFPTANRLKALQQLAEQDAQRVLLLVNPQWRESGQVVSDFGFGPWRKAAEQFLATFGGALVLAEQRVGAPGSFNSASRSRYESGGVVRVLRAAPGPYQVFVMAANGASQQVGAFDARPSYAELDALLKKARAADLPIFQVARQATALFPDSDSDTSAAGPGSAAEADVAEQQAGAQQQREGAPPPGGGRMTDAEVDALDAVTLRRLLGARGLAASGRLAKLRERLREAMAQE